MKSLRTLFQPPVVITLSFPLRFHSKQFLSHCNIQPLQKPISLPMPFMANFQLENYSKPSNCSQSRDFCSDGRAYGDFHVIVGPMFAGKTTTLLQRMKSESSTGSEAADHDGKTVIAAGLDGDYLRRSFGQVLDIIPISDSVTKLTARCEVCGKRAVFTLRKSDETKTQRITGAEVYMPVCRSHCASGQVAKEATRAVLESYNTQFTSVI